MTENESQEIPEAPQIEPAGEDETLFSAGPPDEDETSRVGRLFGGLLRWAAIFAVIFVIGVAITWVVRVRPLQSTNQELAAELETAESDLESLTAEVDALRPLVQEREMLERELTETLLRLSLYRALVDITAAQLGLAEEDIPGARLALDETDEYLAFMEAELGGVEAEDVAELRQRLELLQGELNDNLFAAQYDLEILAGNLIALDRALED